LPSSFPVSVPPPSSLNTRFQASLYVLFVLINLGEGFTPRRFSSRSSSHLFYGFLLFLYLEFSCLFFSESTEALQGTQIFFSFRPIVGAFDSLGAMLYILGKMVRTLLFSGARHMTLVSELLLKIATSSSRVTPNFCVHAAFFRGTQAHLATSFLLHVRTFSVALPFASSTPPRLTSPCGTPRCPLFFGLKTLSSCPPSPIAPNGMRFTAAGAGTRTSL